MALSSSRSIGLSTRTICSRLARPAVSVTRSARRHLETSADNASGPREDLPASMATTSISWKAQMNNADVTADQAVDDMSEEIEDAIRPPRAVQLAYLRPLKRTPEYRIPSCNLQLRSYSARNLEFFTTFALRAAYFLKLPATGPIPLPRIVERWTVPRGHFIHKKSQENFERITMRRLIQIQDGHPETIQMWLAYLRKRQYYGVGMKANVWSFEKLGLGKDMDITADQGKSLKERWEAELNPSPMPEIQAKVDEWIAQHSLGVEPATNDRPATKSSESVPPLSRGDSPSAKARNPLSQAQKVEQILAQIELDAAEAEKSAKEAQSEQEKASSEKAARADPQEVTGTSVPESPALSKADNQSGMRTDEDSEASVEAVTEKPKKTRAKAKSKTKSSKSNTPESSS